MNDRTCSQPDCQRPPHARGLCTTHWSKWYRNSNKITVHCQHCGKTVTKYKGAGTTYCNDRCSAEAATNKLKIKRRRARPREVKGTYTFTCGPCVVCGTAFATNGTDRTCSTQCSKELRRDYERKRGYTQRASGANTKKSKYFRHRVFTADDYRCHICNRKTKPDEPPNHPRYPTIDHIIPLSQGGQDVIENCRTACSICNSTRGNRGGGEQLVLLAL